MLRNPIFTFTAVLTLAIGIGANIAVFALVDGVFLRPLPYEDPAQLVAIWNQGIHSDSFDKRFDSYRDFEAFKKNAQGFDELAAATWAGLSGRVLTGQGPAREIMAVPVSESFFRLLGVSTVLGRTFTPEDTGAGCSIVLAHKFWSVALQSQSGIADRSLVLDSRSCRVLGVMPAGFEFYPRETDLWILITPDSIPQAGVGVFGRLKHGVTPLQALSEVASIHSALHQADGKERDVRPILRDLQGEFSWLAGRNLRATVWVLFAAVNMVLLIACSNIAGLLLGRSSSRIREMAMRAALGSSRGRLIRQLLTEALMLSFMGAGAGIGVAIAALRFVQSASPVELPVGAELSLRLPVLLFTLSISVLSALIFGMAPALRLSGIDVNGSLKTASRGATLHKTSHQFAAVLLIAQTGLSLVLLAGAGLLMKSVLRLDSTPLGFQSENLLMSGVTLTGDAYSNPDKRVRFAEAVQQKVAALPGVLEAAVTSALPPFGEGVRHALELHGQLTAPDHPSSASSQAISPNYFHSMGEALQRGRLFDDRDQPNSQPVAIVNEALVRKYFPDHDPLGQLLRTGESDPWLTVVGVVSDEKHSALEEMVWVEEPVLFRPLSQDPRRHISLAIRAANDRIGAGGSIQQAIASIDPDVPVGTPTTMSHQLSRYVLAYPRFRATLLTGFAAFALLLAGLGLYGVLAQVVGQRTQEIGIRMALGAQERHVIGIVLRIAILPVATGVALGIIGSLSATRWIESMLFTVKPDDPSTIAEAAAFLFLTASVAAFVPARRASRVDPAIALRHE
jgi:putative ABC transport system permease protein